MLTHFLLAISALIVPPAATAGSAPAATASVPAAKADIVHVALDTEKGRILLALDQGRAPLSTANFLRYVDAGRFNGIGFYRAMPYGPGNGLIQAGITRDARLLFPPVEHEPPSRTGLVHAAGSVLFANYGPGTARSDFFITLGAMPTFKDDFALFGRVVEGMDVVKAIFASPVDPVKGSGPMKGQMLEPAIMIRSAKRLDLP